MKINNMTFTYPKTVKPETVLGLILPLLRIYGVINIPEMGNYYNDLPENEKETVSKMPELVSEYLAFKEKVRCLTLSSTKVHFVDIKISEFSGTAVIILNVE